jgi:hypothetical protein
MAPYFFSAQGDDDLGNEGGGGGGGGGQDDDIGGEYGCGADGLSGQDNDDVEAAPGEGMLAYCSQLLRSYKASGHTEQRSLPTNVTTNERHRLHGLCRELHLTSGSKVDPETQRRRFYYQSKVAFQPVFAATGENVVGCLVMVESPLTAEGVIGEITTYLPAAVGSLVPPKWIVELELGERKEYEIGDINNSRQKW